MTTNQGYAADGRTPLHNVPGRELLVSAVAFNGAVAEIARLQAQVAEAWSVHARAVESSGAAIAGHLGTIQDLRAQVDALAGALHDLLDAHARNTLFSGAAHWDVARAALAAAGR